MPLLFIIVLIIANIGSSYFYTRFDFTREKRFTLHPKSMAILAKADKEITVTVFLDGNLPAAFKRLKNATSDLLDDYKASSGVKIKVVFTDPLEGLDQQAQDTVLQNLYSIGIEPTNLNIKNEAGFTQKTVFPMAVVQAGDRQLPVKLLQNLDAAGNYEQNINNSIQNLEYVFSSAIKKVSTGENPRIGFTEGNGEPADPFISDAMRSLSDSYEVGRVDLNVISKEGLDKLKVLFITKPQKEFSEALKYKINYFVMNGGRIVWSIDQVSADLDSLKGKGEQLAFNNKLNLDDMLFMYGARINYNLVADLNAAEIPLAMGGGEHRDIQMAPWVYYPVLVPDASPGLVKNIDGIRTEFLSTVDTIGVKGVRKTVLLHTSPYHIEHNTPEVLSLQIVAEAPDQRRYLHPPAMAAVLLEGSFPSVFLNRQAPAGITENFPAGALSKPTKMIVIGDGDIFKNQVSGRDGSVFPLGFDRYTQRNFGNKALLLNIADYLSSDDNLIDLRNKEVRVRLLDKQLLRSEKLKWQLINVIVPLLLLISFAIFQHYYRKYKYAR
ncbi:gliding motility-associated ABC transporter substrate-binding protein GldG [Pedobacter sp. MC2016-15]|uniref:gliding motility-associated ABC transporter substrate-binding protein GldG n=1 Tax=Pedobacter sp. MC2016-15 TaxID=2994473 RepID=UPI002247E6BE|nr:gliding motility-associated ABC transporter substrate-binding protein GldG [Pedobacter sp. MC2016-15]MCX2479267.1 gliding motility-associated ABC transporter substrate-binding protein GldG [Pedobacter sp. MC2016-15]